MVATASSVLALHSASLASKRVLITGACSGIGYELARAVLEECATEVVYVHGRSHERAESAVESLPCHAHAESRGAVAVSADLSDLRAVGLLADELRSAPPHVIVCCAGVATLPVRTTTLDGHEAQFGINHLAHFHLVRSLLPALPTPCRVVLVSSDLHKSYHQKVGRSNPGPAWGVPPVGRFKREHTREIQHD
jgi:NAD(P)-dependent dehydrogenase (short-subunit alcohol dehydrogenase family)